MLFLLSSSIRSCNCLISSSFYYLNLLLSSSYCLVFSFKIFSSFLIVASSAKLLFLSLSISFLKSTISLSNAVFLCSLSWMTLSFSAKIYYNFLIVPSSAWLFLLYFSISSLKNLISCSSLLLFSLYYWIFLVCSLASFIFLSKIPWYSLIFPSSIILFLLSS